MPDIVGVHMTPDETAQATTGAISGLAAQFMLDPATYSQAGELGFQGMDFYFAGRAGALGDVGADAVVAALVFFEPRTVRQAWERSGTVMSRADAAAAFAEAGHQWARDHLSDSVDLGRLAELAGAVSAAADGADAPIFSGWRALPEPGDVKGKALHRMNSLRELRMAEHGAAIVAGGIDPRAAVLVRTPFLAELFGWKPPHPDAAHVKPQWDEAEAATNRAFGAHLSLLAESERQEFATLAASALASVE